MAAVSKDDEVVDPVELYLEGAETQAEALEAESVAEGPTDVGGSEPTSNETGPEIGTAQAVDTPVENEETAVPSLSCPSGHAVAGDAKFCPVCGTRCGPEPAPSEWTCGLGHLSPPAANFCAECGGQRPQVSVAAVLAQDLQSPRPKPWSQLTPEEKAERERQHQAALAAGRADPPVQYERPRPGANTYLIHFINDGLSAFGRVWFRGQEVELVIGSARWAEAQSWIQMEEWQQEERWGKAYFRTGPWRGRSYKDAATEPWEKLKAADGSELPPPSAEQLAAAEEAERRRGRAVPQPAF